MDKDTREAIEKLAKAHDSLTESSDERIKSLEGRIATMEEFRPDPISDSGSTPTNDEEAARLHEQAVEENARLNDKVAVLEERALYLESPEYQNQVIHKFLYDDMDQDNFTVIGIQRGFLEDTEASPEDLENVEGAEPFEVPLEDNRTLLVQKEKPEDMTGWEFSETQGLYIKIA